MLKAKDGALSSEELEAVLAELSEVVARKTVQPLPYPRGSPIDRARLQLDRLRVHLTKHDLEAARAELDGRPKPHRTRPMAVRRALVARGPVKLRHDPYDLLEIVGEVGGSELAEYVEPFLDWPGDPMLAGLALQILTEYWGVGSKYRDQIIGFMHGLPWDTDQWVREIAISAAGDAYRQQEDAELLRKLLEIAEDADEPASTRGQALVALGRAEGIAWRELPSVSEDMQLDSSLARAILKRARELTAGPLEN